MWTVPTPFLWASLYVCECCNDVYYICVNVYKFIPVRYRFLNSDVCVYIYGLVTRWLPLLTLRRKTFVSTHCFVQYEHGRLLTEHDWSWICCLDKERPVLPLSLSQTSGCMTFILCFHLVYLCVVDYGIWCSDSILCAFRTVINYLGTHALLRFVRFHYEIQLP